MAVIQEMRAVCQLRKPGRNGKMVLAGHWANRNFVRLFSIYITWFFVKIGVSANAVTFLMILVALAGSALCIPHLLWANILGVVLLNLTRVLDCVDGEVARWTGKSSLKGLYLDLISHVLWNPTVPMLCAIHLYVWKGDVTYLVLAFITYAAAQCLLGAHSVYWRVTVEDNLTRAKQTHEPPDSSPTARSQVRNRRIGSLAKFLIYLPADQVVVILFTAISIFLCYVGTDVPLIVFSWFYAGYGMIVLGLELFSKYFLYVSGEHFKKV